MQPWWAEETFQKSKSYQPQAFEWWYISFFFFLKGNFSSSFETNKFDVKCDI